MTALNMARHRNNPNFAFWKEIKEGYDHFEATHQEPKVAVCEKRYVFDAVSPENASRPLSFNARGKCPVFKLDSAIADAVLDYRRKEQVAMADFIAHGVATVPFRVGDGGMNPVFEAKLTGRGLFDNDGHVFQVAGDTHVPGALPRTPNRPAAQPTVMASVPMPQPAPQAKEGEAPPEQPKTIAGLLGNLFGGPKAQAQPVEQAESQSVALRGSKTAAAKPKQSAPVRTAAVPHPRPQTAQPVQQAGEDSKQPPAPEMRTAYSSPPPASKNGLLQGAQPVVPAGSFESRWTALR